VLTCSRYRCRRTWSALGRGRSSRGIKEKESEKEKEKPSQKRKERNEKRNDSDVHNIGRRGGRNVGRAGAGKWRRRWLPSSARGRPKKKNEPLGRLERLRM
jgi:hypothetical protein